MSISKLNIAFCLILVLASLVTANQSKGQLQQLRDPRIFELKKENWLILADKLLPEQYFKDHPSRANTWYTLNNPINTVITTNVQTNIVLYTTPFQSTATINHLSLDLTLLPLQFPSTQPVTYGVALYVLPSGSSFGTINLTNQSQPLLNFYNQVIDGYVVQTRDCSNGVQYSFDSYDKPGFTPIQLGPGDRIVVSILSTGPPGFLSSVVGNYNQMLSYP